jgi:DNA-binding CsgD family transcriptional regulator
MPLGKALLASLERMRLGGIILDAKGCVIDFNSVARAALQIGSDINGHEAAERVRTRLKDLLRSGESRFSLDESPWVLVPRDGKRPLAVYAMAAGGREDPHSRSVVITIDFDEAPQPSLPTLQRVFGLTRSEATLAAQIAGGATLTDIAAEKHVSLATIRSQMAALFDKTHTHRQAHLVALLARVAALP